MLEFLSDLPVIFDIPEDPGKKAASEALDARGNDLDDTDPGGGSSEADVPTG